MSATASVPVPSISYSSPSSEDTETTSSSTIQLSCSQSTESTVTLSSPSRDSEVLKVSQTKASVECQTTEVIVISKDEYEKLLQKTANIIDIEGDLEKLKTFFLAYDPQPPKMDPDRFQEICAQAGVANLFSILNNAMSSTRMSDERQQLTKLRVLVMVVLYIMMYSRSQRANWFQLSLARTLQQFGISHQGLASLRNLGIVAHPRTMKASMLALSASHLDRVKGFFQTVIEKEQFSYFVLMITIISIPSTVLKVRPKPKQCTPRLSLSRFFQTFKLCLMIIFTLYRVYQKKLNKPEIALRLCKTPQCTKFFIEIGCLGTDNVV